MSFVCRRLISRSQKWLKHSVQLVYSEQRNKGSLSCQFSSLSYIWGAGDGGQLGTGTQEHSIVPIKFPVPREVSHVGCGYGFTVAAEANSCSLWTTGLNSLSQLGRQPSCSNGPVELGPATIDLNTTPSTRVQQISCGRSHSAILLDNGEVLTCGGHFHGQCGVGNMDTRSIQQFTNIPSIVDNIKQIACGLDHTLLLSYDGKVVSCGWGVDGQTGLGHYKDEATFKLIEGELKDVRIKQVATSADCCLALSDEGEVFCWGNNEYGQLATESDEEQSPKRASSTEESTRDCTREWLQSGSFCVLFLLVTGELYSWGYGVLGHGQEVSFSKSPRKIQEFSCIDETATRVFCGTDSSAVINRFVAQFSNSGTLYTWGMGSFGRLGLGSNQDQWIPRKVELPGDVIEYPAALITWQPCLSAVNISPEFVTRHVTQHKRVGKPDASVTSHYINQRGQDPKFDSL
ncbi:Williams-Beuren syndrome chromosome region 16 protein [Desmophyllum pertusum]|uniref:Williams-Beuren syndrome chromosome region 16 protein n=1 Tax=Desmophyllum pertusum TaxID=174260 RepID=A0A9W9YV49_9CNID|nr:Williams-Beuren syndrome chromosome region 16 protein [Desmophyllum pertusum]